MVVIQPYGCQTPSKWVEYHKGNFSAPAPSLRTSTTGARVVLVAIDTNNAKFLSKTNTKTRK